MRVFKHLVAMADIAVGFLGLFFIIFAVARPNSAVDSTGQQEEFERLKEKLHELETLELAPSQSGRSLPNKELASIMLTPDGIRIVVRGSASVSTTHDDFRSTAAKINWPGEVVYYIDRRVTFEKVVSVIDALKQLRPHIAVRIAALVQ